MNKKVILLCCSISCLFFCKSMVVSNKIIANQPGKLVDESPKDKLRKQVYTSIAGLTSGEVKAIKESKEKLAAQVLFANHNKQPNNNCRYLTTKIGNEKK